MKILCLTESLGSGGAERQLVRIAIMFQSKGHEVDFLIYEENEFFAAELIQHDIKILKVYDYSPFKRILAIRQIIRQSNYNLLISFLIGPNFSSVLAGLPNKDWLHIAGERGSSGLNYNFKTRLERRFLKFADIITTNSYTNKREIVKAVPFIAKENVSVIYNALDLNIWKPTIKPRTENKIRKLLIAASHSKIKNGINLIRALKQLSVDEQEKLVVMWYGNAPKNIQRDRILIRMRTLIQEYNLQKVLYLLPATSNILSEMQESDGVGLFSFDEGLPNAICEGMACGKPIVSTKVSDIPLLITDNYNGFLCDANDISSITNALRRFISSDIEALVLMGRRNRAKALEIFDENKIFDEYMILIEEGINAKDSLYRQ